MNCTIPSFHVEGCKQGLYPYAPCTLAIVIPSVMLLCASEILHMLFAQPGILHSPLVCFLDLVLYDSHWNFC